MSKDRIESERKFWSKFASHYDRFMGSNISSYSTLVGKIREELNPAWIALEVAAGTGLITLEIAEKVKKIYAVDITPEMIAQAREKAQVKGIKNVEFSAEDAYSLPFPDFGFDVAICTNALHNMVEPQKALMEMRRVLKVPGKLIVPTFCHGEGLKSQIISRLMAIPGFPAHQRFTERELIELVEDSGFSIEKSEIIRERIPMAFIVGRKSSLR